MIRQLLTEDDAAAYLGIGARTLRGIRSKGMIRYIRTSPRTIRYTPEDLDEYLAPRAVEPTPPAREFDPIADIPTAPCVYFVRSGRTGPIKIGHAKRLRARLHALSTAHHEQLILLATLAGGEVQERRLHSQFSAYRLRGEWFEASDELLDFIETIRGMAKL